MAFGSFIDNALLHDRLWNVEVKNKYRASFYQLLSTNIAARGLSPRREGNTDYGLLDQIASQPIMVTGRVRQGNVVNPADGVTAQGKVYTYQLAGATGWDIEALENAGSDQELLSVVMGSPTTGGWNHFLNGFHAVLNAVSFGDRTGRLARVSACTDNTTYYTITVDNSQQDFGWHAGAMLENGMLVDIFTVADITGSSAWTVKVRLGEVYGLNKYASSTTATFNVRAVSGVTAPVTSALTAAAADGDFVFIGGAVTLTAANKFSAWNLPTGLHDIIAAGDGTSTGYGYEFDAGTNYANGSYAGITFQGLNRQTYPLFSALVRRPTDWYGAADNSALCTGDLEVLYGTLDRLFMSGSTPDPEALLLLCSPRGRRWIGDKAAAGQNVFEPVTGGHVLAGRVADGIRMPAGSRDIIVPIKTDLAIPDGRFIFSDMRRIGRWVKAPLGPIAPDGTSSPQFGTPGSRGLTFERWARVRENPFASCCDTCAVLDGVNLAA